MSASSEIAQDIFGVYELSLTGVVLYSRSAQTTERADAPRSHIGLNFFDDVTAFENAAELRCRLESFMQNNNSVESFVFTCVTEQDVVRARVMLVRISERSEFGRTKSIIIDIRKD